MSRFFGSKSKTPAPTLQDQVNNCDARVKVLDDKIKGYDQELHKYKQQMAKMRPGPAKNQVKQKAMRVLKQKKQYENQREMVSNQAFTMDQTAYTIQSLKDTQNTVTAMKAANKQMKKEFKKTNVDKVHDLFDEMEDIGVVVLGLCFLAISSAMASSVWPRNLTNLRTQPLSFMMEDANEIQEVMGRQFGCPEIDEDDLEAELDALGDDLFDEEGADYLDVGGTTDQLPDAPTGVPSNTNPANTETDEFGLPTIT